MSGNFSAGYMFLPFVYVRSTILVIVVMWKGKRGRESIGVP